MLIGAHLDGVPQQGLEALSAVEERVGAINIVHWFQAWGGGHRGYQPGWFDAVAASGRLGLVTWEPWALTGEITQPTFSPAAIAAGHHDRYITTWAEGLARRDDGPWYLRPMHEMNGDWYPWAGGVDGNDPAAYRAAWVHLHDLFAAAGVGSRVRWVWCPLADDPAGPEAIPFEAYYPGAAYVDVLGLDGYNWGADHPHYGGWRSPAEIFERALLRVANLGPHPVWLAEIGSAPEGGDKAAWVAEALALGDDPRLEAVVWFNLDKERDWRIEADDQVARSLRRARVGRGGRRRPTLRPRRRS